MDNTAFFLARASLLSDVCIPYPNQEQIQETVLKTLQVRPIASVGSLVLYVCQSLFMNQFLRTIISHYR